MESVPRLDPVRVHVKGIGSDIHKHGFGIEQGDHLSGGNPGVGNRDDLVSRTDIERHEGDQKRIGAG